jgi:hypothetical protein
MKRLLEMIFAAVLTAQAASAQSVSSAQERLDSIIVTNSYAPRKYTYSYKDGRLASETCYEKAASEWSLLYKYVFDFNEDGHHIGCIDSVMRRGVWQQEYAFRNTFNADGELQQSVYHYPVKEGRQGKSVACYLYDKKKLAKIVEFDENEAGLDTFQIRTFHYDKGKRRISVWSKLIKDKPESYRYEDTYDSNGNLVEQITYDLKGTDGRELSPHFKTAYKHDAAGRLVETVCWDLFKGIQKEREKAEYEYDVHGNLVQKKHFIRKGEVWDHTSTDIYIYDMNVGSEQVAGLQNQEFVCMNEPFIKSAFKNDSGVSPNKILKKVTFNSSGKEDGSITFYYSPADKESFTRNEKDLLKQR